MGIIVNARWLEEQLEKDQVCIVDCRFYLNDAERGYKEYKESHIPGAVYFDLEKDLSETPETHGGRHPLPKLDHFVEKLSQAGIGNETRVIAYDDQGGMMAARFWWMLQYIGHQHVYVLDRPFSMWQEEGRPVEQNIPAPKRKVYEPEMMPNKEASIEEVKLALHDQDVSLIDARDVMRYRGVKDDVDGKAGHIPGASHYFWKGVLNDDGTWKDKADLELHFKPLFTDKEVISYCGSGVTACANALALEEAGYENVRVYVGSWSDWVTYDDLPIETGEKD